MCYADVLALHVIRPYASHVPHANPASKPHTMALLFQRILRCPYLLLIEVQQHDAAIRGDQEVAGFRIGSSWCPLLLEPCEDCLSII